jgi:transposase-like protein
MLKSAKTKAECPKCSSLKTIKSGIVNNRQRYKCKKCNYNFTVNKLGKNIDVYYVVKALQLYMEGLSYREIERILGISHVTVMNWVKRYNVKRIADYEYHPTYRILSHEELKKYITNQENLKGHGMVLTELGDKYMLIKWERFREI